MSAFRRVATGDTAVIEKAYGPVKGSVNGEMGGVPALCLPQEQHSKLNYLAQNKLPTNPTGRGRGQPAQDETCDDAMKMTL